MIAYYVNFNALIPRMTAIVLLSTALSAPVSADVYRWVESDGTVNFGERVPKNQEFTIISRSAPAKAGSRIIDRNYEATPNAAPRTAGGNPLPDDDNLSEQQRAMLSEIQAAESARVAAVNKVRKANCASSQKTLSNLQTNGRIRVRNDAGEESAMTDEDRAERISQAQNSIVANCDSLS